MPKPKPRDKIVDALMALSAEQPFEDVTLSKLAERAGVSLAQIREGYDGRVSVLAEYIRQVDERVLAGIDPGMAEESPDAILVGQVRHGDPQQESIVQRSEGAVFGCLVRGRDDGQKRHRMGVADGHCACWRTSSWNWRSWTVFRTKRCGRH